MSAVIISAHNNTLHCAEMSPAGTTMPSDVGTTDLHICTWHRVPALVVCHHHNIWATPTQSTLHRFHFRTFGPKIWGMLKILLMSLKYVIVVWWLLVWHQLPWNVLICSDLGPGKKQSWKSLFDVVQINIFHIPAYLIFWCSKNIISFVSFSFICICLSRAVSNICIFLR